MKIGLWWILHSNKITTLLYLDNKVSLSRWNQAPFWKPDCFFTWAWSSLQDFTSCLYAILFPLLQISVYSPQIVGHPCNPVRARKYSIECFVTPNTLTSVISIHIFHTFLSTLSFSLVLTRRICSTRKASEVGDHSLNSRDLNEWFRSFTVRRNYMLVTLRV